MAKSLDRMYTHEEIDRSIAKMKKGNAKAFSAAAAAAPAGLKDQICGFYCPIRPLLVTISNIPLIPANWRSALKLFITLMDQLCQCKE